MLKKQERKCKFCLKTETRIVDFSKSSFINDEKYFLKWNSNCTFCNKNSWESISESYLTKNIDEMKLKDSIIDIWRKDDTKNFNPQSDSYEFSNIEIKKIFLWIDAKDTTVLKRQVLIESLCDRLDDLIFEKIFNNERKLLINEFVKRKEMIIENIDFLDSETKKTILECLTEYKKG